MVNKDSETLLEWTQVPETTSFQNFKTHFENGKNHYPKRVSNSIHQNGGLAEMITCGGTQRVKGHTWNSGEGRWG